MSKTENWVLDITKEIIDLHEFFQNWFNGTIPESDFTRFSKVMDAGFQIISPRGDLTNISDLVDILTNAYAKNKKIKISVAEVTVKLLSTNLFLATYKEIQNIGKETTSRISSAIFKRSMTNKFTWLHVHETWE